MLDYLTQNIGTIVISLLLIAVVSLIIVKMIKDRKNGKSTCGCGCENCSMSGSCHPEKNQ